MLKNILFSIFLLFSFSCSNSEPTANSAKSLKRFLDEKDLDDLQKIAFSLEKFNKEDNTLINSILDNWNDNQAISNLLFYPNLIPNEIRFKTLLKGLKDKENPYYNLAVIVGIQSPENLNFTDNQLTQLKKELFEFVEKTNDIRSMRSTTSLHQYIDTSDTQRIIKCAVNEIDVVQTNLLSMISTLHGKENIRSVLVKNEAVLKNEAEMLLKELEKQELKIEDAPEDKKGFFKLTLGMPLSSYIPNLNEFK